MYLQNDVRFTCRITHALPSEWCTLYLQNIARFTFRITHALPSEWRTLYLKNDARFSFGIFFHLPRTFMWGCGFNQKIIRRKILNIKFNACAYWLKSTVSGLLLKAISKTTSKGIIEEFVCKIKKKYEIMMNTGFIRSDIILFQTLFLLTFTVHLISFVMHPWKIHFSIKTPI